MTRTRNRAGHDFGRVIRRRQAPPPTIDAQEGETRLAGRDRGFIIRRRKAPWAAIAKPSTQSASGVAALGALLVAAPAAAQLDPPAWTRPRPPVPIVGPITYVGSEGLAAYLIRTDKGAILIDATMAQNVPAIARNIVASGVPLRDVKLILVSHAHFDHVAGLAAMRRLTGAAVVAGAGDAAALRSGIPPGETNYGIIRFPPVPVARTVRNGDRIRLGRVTMQAVATPGHTPGCTTWATRITDRGRPLDVVFPCSVTVAGNKLVGNRRYPGIAADYRVSFARLAALPADVVLPGHPEMADVIERQKAGTLVAPGLLRAMVLKARDDFDRELAKQARAALERAR